MPRRRTALILGHMMACAAVIIGVLYPPAFVASLVAQDRPAVSAGDPVPPVEEPPLVHLAIAGDTGTGDAAELATAQRMMIESWGDPYDALVLLGDLVYEDGQADLIDRDLTQQNGDTGSPGEERDVVGR